MGENKKIKRCMGCMQEMPDNQEVCPFCGYVEGTLPQEVYHMPPGSILAGKYLVGKTIGYGGFGVTYVGYDLALERKVAIKEYLPGEFSTRVPGQEQVTIYGGEKSEQFASGIEKFLDEARRLAQFENIEGIVSVFDSFEANGTAYIVMEYVDGVTLKEKLKQEGRLSVEEALGIILPITAALKEVHKAGILHRDIAPDNIMIGTDGKVRLIDFGAARFATTTHSKSLSVLIKAGYAPLEQYQSRGMQGPWSDVYSLAATFYAMLVGVAPQESIERAANDQLKSPSKMGADVTKNMDIAIMNALNLKAEERTQSMEKFEEELLSQKEVARLAASRDKQDTGKWPLWIKTMLGAVGAGMAVFLFLLGTGKLSVESLDWGSGTAGQSTVVPNFVNLQLSAAMEYADARLIAHNEIEGDYDNDVAADHVITQSVAAGTVYDGQTIDWKVSRGKEMVEMPKVTSLSLEEAKKKLEASKFTMTEESLVIVYVEGQIKDQVMTQNPKEGDVVTLVDTVITLTVSDGSVVVDDTVMVEVPDLTGMNYEEARSILQELLLVAKDHSLGYSLDYPKANQVVKQYETAGTKVPQGTEIAFDYSLGDTREIPDVKKVMVEDAVKKLTETQFKYSIVEGWYDGDVGLVYDQSPTAKARRKIQSEVVLYVSKGPDPSKQQAIPTQAPVQVATPSPTQAPTPVPTPVPTWSSWGESLPSDVTEAGYNIEKKTQYRYQDLQTTTSTSDLTGQGWTKTGTTASYGEWGGWSEWSDTAPTASETVEVVAEKMYRYQDNTPVDTSSWGSWSEWQDAAVAQTSTCKVETRQVDDYSSPIYKTQYQYDRWAEKSDGWGHNGPVKGTWGGVYCQYHIYSDWMDTPLSVVNTQYSNQVGGNFNNYGSWYNETTRQVETGSYNQKTQYRYSNLVISSKDNWGNWSEWSTTPVSNSSTRNVETKAVYRYRTRSKTETYSYTKWGSWSDWSDTQATKSSTRNVETKEMYRYKRK